MAHVNSPASWTTRGEDHPTARLSGPGPGKVRRRVPELAAERGEDFRAGVRIGGWIPFQGQQERHCLACSKMPPACSMPFRIVTLASTAPGEVRRRVRQETLGHRGRTGDPLYQIWLLLRASRDRLTKRQQERLRAAFTADEAHN